jgi:hypothetical protein
MADGSPTRLHAAPKSLPPGNTLGYDLDDPTMRAAINASRTDPMLAEAFNDELRREQARFARWTRECDRWDGVRPVGEGPGPFTPADPAALLEQARDAVRSRIAWRQSPAGRQSAGIAAAEKAVHALQMALDELSAANSRNPRTCARYAVLVEEAAVKAFAAAAVLPGLAARAADHPEPENPHVADLHRTIHDIVMSQGAA